VDELTTSATIEVHRPVDRDGYAGLGGTKVLLDPPLVVQCVTLRFDGALMHVLAAGRLIKTLPARARSEPPRHTSRNTTRSGATATTGNPHCVRCDASTRTDPSPSPDSASVSAGPTPARPSSSPLRTLPSRAAQ
jgi:hypothetical protein